MSENPESVFARRLEGQKVVDHFNQAEAGWVQASEITRELSGRSEQRDEIRFSFEKLSDKNVDGAKKLVEEVFPFEKDVAGADIESQIRPSAGVHLLHGGEFGRNYWIAKSETGEFLGITGFSSFDADKSENCWLGWFALKPGLRGVRLGEKLLEKARAEAGATGKKDMYIMSSDNPLMEGNAKFYHKNGALIVAVLNKQGVHRGTGSENVPQPMLEKLCDDYAVRTRTDGRNIFVRRLSLAAK